MLENGTVNQLQSPPICCLVSTILFMILDPKRMTGHLIAWLPPGVEGELVWCLCGIFKGAINSKFNREGLLSGGNNSKSTSA